MSIKNNKSISPKRLSDEVGRIFATLTPREGKVLRMSFGLGERQKFSIEEIAQDFGTNVDDIKNIETTALRKLRHPSRAKLLKDVSEEFQEAITPPIELSAAVEKANTLTLELIQHLKSHHEDIEKIPWEVFEHLVAEFLAANGFDDVRLVGRDPETSADIYAAQINTCLGSKIRFFVEVKRYKNRVGVEVINSILGAMLTEKEKFGWHAGLIVTVGGFKDFKKFSKAELQLRGVELKDQNDLLRWLENYKPNKNGLWLQEPSKKMPTASELTI